MSAILLDDKILLYEILGRARPIVFLYDWVGPCCYWISAMQTAAMSYRAYAFDLWGFGETASEPSCYSMEQQTTLLDRFMQEMGISKFALI